jgi:hypothetical protein
MSKSFCLAPWQRQLINWLCSNGIVLEDEIPEMMTDVDIDREALV